MPAPQDEARAPVGLRSVPWAVWAGIGLYVAVFGTMALLQFHSLNLQPVDRYAAEQRMWNALHGSFLRSDNSPLSFLSEHVQLFDLLLVPIYALAPRLETLLILHVAVAATSCLPVWLFAAEVPGSRRLASAFAAAWLLHPGLHYASLELSGAAYNPVLYCVPFLAWGLLFLHRGQIGRWAACSALALLVKEEIALLVFMQALYVAAAKGKGRPGVRRAGLAAAALSFAWFALSVWVVIPHFAGHQSHVLAIYSGLGHTSREILLRLLREPWLVPQRLVPVHALPIDYMVFDLEDKWRRIYSPDSPPPHERYLASGEFETIFEKEGFIVLRRRPLG